MPVKLGAMGVVGTNRRTDPSICRSFTALFEEGKMRLTLPKLLTIEQASEKSGIAKTTLRSWAKSLRSFPATEYLGRVLINGPKFIRWLKIVGKKIAE